jgi:chromosome partitioning protein
MVRRRAICSPKGGVGKTTIACNLAAVSAHSGKKTLVIDLDPQGASTSYLLGSNESRVKATLTAFFEELLYRTVNPQGLPACIHRTPFEGLDLIPSHPDLESLAEKLESRRKMDALKEALSALPDYDEVYIDTPPALNFYTRAALIAANGCLVPFDCDHLSRQSLYRLLDFVREVKANQNADLALEGIVVNQFQVAANLPRQIVNELIAEGLPVLHNWLSSSIRIRESRAKALPMVYLEPRHKLTLQFAALYGELDR